MLVIFCCLILAVDGDSAINQGQPVALSLHKQKRSAHIRAPLRKLLARNGHHNLTLVLGGNVWPTGGYWTMIGLGSPPQAQQVQLDTGSSDLIVASSSCQGCGDPRYDSQSSTSSTTASCSTTQFKCALCSNHGVCFMNNTYETCNFADPTAYCSLVGPCHTDVVHIGSLNARVGFGSIAQLEGAFDNEWTNMAGVMGLAYDSLAGVWLNHTVLSTLVSQHQIDDVFGMCISQQGGVLNLGGYDDHLFAEPKTLHWTPIIKRQWYVIKMTDAGVNGVSVSLPSQTYNRLAGGTILDSGTNTLVIAGEAFEALKSLFCHDVANSSLCSLFSGRCLHLGQPDIDALPHVYVQLHGTGQLPLRGTDYLVGHRELKGHYCLGIQSSGTGGFTILGNVFQHRYYVVFDRVRHRLGFAQSNVDCIAE